MEYPLRPPDQNDQVVGMHVNPMADDDTDPCQCIDFADAIQQYGGWNHIHQPLVAGQYAIGVTVPWTRQANPVLALFGKRLIATDTS